MKTAILLVLLAHGVACGQPSTQTVYTNTKEALRGLADFVVLTEPPTPEEKRIGITGDALRTTVVERLLSLGIRQSERGNSYLYVKVRASCPTATLCFYVVQIDFNTDLLSPKSAIRYRSPSVWSLLVPGMTSAQPRNEWQQSVLYGVERFALDYLAAHFKN